MNNRTVCAVAALVILGAIVAAIRPGFTSSQSSSDDVSDVLLQALENPDTSIAPVAARVNGTEIKGELIGRDITLGREMAAVDVDQVQPSGKDILNVLIDRELVFQEAERQGLLCSDEEVKQLSEYMTRGTVNRATFSAYYAVPPDEVYLIPDLLEQYSKMCAAVNLFTAVIPPETLRSLGPDMQQMRLDYINQLRASATIEILDPSLE